MFLRLEEYLLYYLTRRILKQMNGVSKLLLIQDPWI